MTRVLVTGATGFVGRAAIAALARTGVEVHGTARSAVFGSLPSTVTFHSVDLLAGDGRRLIARLRPTHLLHLAWITTPGVYSGSPQNAAWAAASKELAAQFARLGGRRIVAVGSYAEYAAHSTPRSETDPEDATTPYSAAKLQCRQRLSELASSTGLEFVWARLTNMFGPHEDPRRVVAMAMGDLLAGRVAEFGSCDAVRDFQYIDDTGDALARLVLSSWAGTVNVSSDERHSVRSVVERIADLVGAGDRVRFGVKPPHPFDPPFLGAQGQLLREVTGWRPRTGLDDALTRTLDWWRGKTHAGAA
jgi:nucleoside-diphosphate-sugar epimerase